MSLSSLHALRDAYLLQHAEAALRVSHLAAQLSQIETNAAIQYYPEPEQKRIREKYERLNDLRLQKFTLEQNIKETDLEIKKLTILANFQP
jgi:hypothetical protein